MTAQNYIDNEVWNIIKFYRHISRFLFWSGIYIVLIVLSALFVFFIIGEIQINLGWDIISGISLWQVKSKDLISANKMEILNNYKKDGVKYEILWWYIFWGSGQTYSYNNLSSINKIVLPYRFYVDKETLSQYSSLKNTDMKFLLDFVLKNILLKNPTDDDSVDVQDQWVKSLTNDDISKTFNLICLDSFVVTPFCQLEIDNYLNNVSFYDLSKDMVWVRKIYNKLRSKWYKDAVCKSYQNYTNFALDFNDSFYSIFQDCGGEYLSNYQLSKDFNNINQNIISNSLDNKLYSTQSLNAYKLLSFQKLIYVNYEYGKNFNVDLIWVYLSFVSNLLSEQKIWDPYYDIIYLYDNFYLSQVINVQKSNSNQKISDAIPKLTEKITSTNKWDGVFIDKWLEKLIKNKKLIELSNKSTSISVGPSQEVFPINKFQSLINSLDGYYATTIKMEDKDNTIYYAKWTLEKSFSTEWTNTKSIVIKIDLYYKYDWNSFHMQNVKVSDYPDLEKVINQRIKKKFDFDFSDILEIVRIFPLEKNVSVSFCNRIQGLDFVWGERPEVRNCSESDLVLSREEITYTFHFNDEILDINSIQISDLGVQQQVYNSLSWNTNIIKDTFLNILPTLLNFKAEQSADEEVNDIIIIKLKIRSYLWIELDDIAKKDDKNYHLKFSLNSYQMECDINKSENYRLYNLTIFGWQKSYNLQKFSLNLLDSEKTKINKFRLDPIWYIKEYLK